MVEEKERDGECMTVDHMIHMKNILQCYISCRPSSASSPHPNNENKQVPVFFFFFFYSEGFMSRLKPADDEVSVNQCVSNRSVVSSSITERRPSERKLLA